MIRAAVRRKGATFCIIVLLASALLLSIGGAFVEASRNLVVLTGLRERHEQAREALAGAAAWAHAAVSQGQSPGKATLELSRGKVDVTLRLAEGGDAYFMEATARVGEVERRAKASIARREGRWVVTRFELLEGASEGAKQTAEPPGGDKKKFR
jgi:hypothetical protein